MRHQSHVLLQPASWHQQHFGQVPCVSLSSLQQQLLHASLCRLVGAPLQLLFWIALFEPTSSTQSHQSCCRPHHLHPLPSIASSAPWHWLGPSEHDLLWRRRSDESLVGTECVSTCRSRGSPFK